MEAPILNVSEEPVGTDLDADVAAGATVLTPSNIEMMDFEGGTAILGDPEGTYEEITYNPIATDGDGLPTDTTITFTPALANAYTSDASTPILLTNGGEILVERYVYIKPALQEEEGKVLLPPERWELLEVGTRDQETSELVVCDYDDDLGQMVVESVVARRPQRTAEFIIPDTFTEPPSDGNPPASSPTPTVRGGLGALVVSWSAVTNNDPVTYDVHVSDASGFTPSPATLSQSIRSTQAWVRNLPDGTALAYEVSPGAPKLYYVRIVARDEDGEAPAGAEASGSAVQVTSPDIAAENVVASHLLADEALFSKIQSLLIVTNTLKTAESGQRVEIDFDGVRWFDATGALGINFPTENGQPAILNADLVARTIDVLGSMNLRSPNNTMDPGSALTLQSTLSDPGVAPSVAVNFEQLALTGGNAEQTSGTGIFHTATGGAAGTTPTFYASQDTSSVSVLEEYNAATGALARTLFTAPVGEKIIGAVQATVGGVKKIFVLTGVYFGGVFVPAIYRLDNATLAQDFKHLLTGGTGLTAGAVAANDAAAGSTDWQAFIGINPGGTLAAAVASAGDSNYVAAQVDASNPTHYLKVSNLGFSVPSNAIVTGITVQVRRKNYGSVGTVTDAEVKLAVAGAVSGSNRAKADAWPRSPGIDTGLETVTYGSTSDKWGLSLTPAQVNAAGFGVAIRASAIGNPVALIDQVRVTVQYSELPNNTVSGSAALGLVSGVPKIISYSSASQTAASQAAMFDLSTATGATTAQTNLTGKNYTPADNATRFAGLIDDGTSLWVSVRGDPTHGSINHRFNKTTFAYEANHDFGGTVFFNRGLAWDGTRFWSRSGGAPSLAKHTLWDWTTENANYWIAYTWYDGTHESLVSPRTQLDLTGLRRARLLITVPAFPSGVTKARVYVARAATAPATTALLLQAAPTYVTTDSNVSIYEVDFNAAGAAPPTVNSFTVGTPAKIKSAPTAAGLETWVLGGAGSLKLLKGTDAVLAAYVPAEGEACIAYNSTQKKIVVWDGSTWRPVPGNLGTWFSPAGGSAPASATVAANTLYVVQVVVPAKAVLTGIAYIVGAASVGNVRSALYDAAGTRVANRAAGVAQAAAASAQQVAFDATYEAWPGTYFAALQFSNATGTALFSAALALAAALAQGSFASPASIAVPSGMASVPRMTTY